MIDARRRCGAQPAPDAPLDTEALFGEPSPSTRRRRRLGLGPARRDGYVGWLPAKRADRAARGADAPGHGAAHFAFPGPSIKLPPLIAVAGQPRRGAARSRIASRSPMPGYLPAAPRAARRIARRTSSPSPSGSSARHICGAARPASASTAPASCSSRCLPAASPARATATCRSSGARRTPADDRDAAARRPGVLEGPCRDHAGRRR